MSEILRKLTIRNCGWPVADIKDALTIEKTDATSGKKSYRMDGEKALLKIVGRSTAAKPGQSDNGEYVKLLGSFHAVNLVTGETFESGQCILPNFVSEQLAAALVESQAVEFALEIGVKADDASVTGYVFTVRPLIKPEPTDGMRKLLAAAGMSAPPKLEAPADAPKGKAKAPAAV